MTYNNFIDYLNSWITYLTPSEGPPNWLFPSTPPPNCLFPNRAAKKPTANKLDKKTPNKEGDNT